MATTRSRDSHPKVSLPAQGGVLLLDKPAGPTSHDMVGAVRRALRTRKVGHTGTLDPFATGLLVICVGPATRISRYLTGLDKRYIADVRLGVSTDTLDLHGQVVARAEEPPAVTLGQVEAALSRFRGPILQVPPQFSAKKVGGEAMHRKARRGEHVELEAVPVEVHSLEVLSLDGPDLRLDVHCGSGTYVRALARDLGEILRTGAHLTGLRRTAVGRHSVESAISAEDLDDPIRTARALRAPAEALSHLPAVEVDGEEARRIRSGQPVAADPSLTGLHRAILGSVLVAVGECREGSFHPRTVLPSPPEAAHEQ
jgi:tRNA pseudouridine55 synthase